MWQVTWDYRMMDTHSGLMWGLLIWYRTWWDIVKGTEAGHKGPLQEQTGVSAVIDGRWCILRPLYKKASMELLPCDAPELKTAAKKSGPQGTAEGEGLPALFSMLWSRLLGEQPLGPWTVRGTAQGLIQLAHLPVSESCKEGWRTLLHSFFHVFFGSSVSPFTVVIICESLISCAASLLLFQSPEQFFTPYTSLITTKMGISSTIITDTSVYLSSLLSSQQNFRRMRIALCKRGVILYYICRFTGQRQSLLENVIYAFIIAVLLNVAVPANV